MKAEWLSENYSYEQIILAGDVGGTNANVALVGRNGGDFTIIIKCVFRTAEVADFVQCLKDTLEQAYKKDSSLKPALCCVSAAGPVKNNYCKLSNSNCVVDGGEIEKSLGIKALVINDFSAISYGLPLLDVNNPKQITPLPHLDGSAVEQSGSVRAVAGAGTGLGVGFIIDHDGKYVAYPSEGGHIAFTSFDKETRELHDYMAERTGELMEVELYVSGAGIANIFHYFKDVRKVKLEGILADIDKADDSDKPAMISKNAGENDVCRDILKLFVKLYGRLAADVSVILIPTMGMYLGGGIVTKNEKYFVEDDVFMDAFENCYHPNIRKLLKRIPVYIVRDYSVSLYGAANAAYCLV
jgi:glucokinase